MSREPAARFSLRGADRLLLPDAGCGHGQRPRRLLLPVRGSQGARSRRRARGRSPSAVRPAAASGSTPNLSPRAATGRCCAWCSSLSRATRGQKSWSSMRWTARARPRPGWRGAGRSRRSSRRARGAAGHPAGEADVGRAALNLFDTQIAAALWSERPAELRGAARAVPAHARVEVGHVHALGPAAADRRAALLRTCRRGSTCCRWRLRLRAARATRPAGVGARGVPPARGRERRARPSRRSSGGCRGSPTSRRRRPVASSSTRWREDIAEREDRHVR